MKALARSLQRLEESGEALNLPWPSVSDLVQPRPGNLLICLGAPGVGKSTIGIEWAKSLTHQNEPVLYLTLDTPMHDQGARLASTWNGKATVKEMLENPRVAAEYLQAQRTKDGQPLPLRFSDLLMGVDEVSELVEAESEWFGRYPALIIVDNASDLIEEEESRSSFMRLFRSLDAIAKDTGAVVLALHHIRRGNDPALSNGLRAPTMTDGAFAGEQKAQAVLSVWRPREGIMCLAILKNRMGPASPSGDLFKSLNVDLSRSSVWEPPPGPTYTFGPVPQAPDWQQGGSNGQQGLHPGGQPSAGQQVGQEAHRPSGAF